jgi:hypothetical protein
MVELGIAGGYAARHGGANLMGNVRCLVVCSMAGQRRVYIARRRISRRVMALIVDVEIRAISMGNQQSGHVCVGGEGDACLGSRNSMVGHWKRIH